MARTPSSDRMQHDYQLVCDARDHGSYKAYADLMSAYREPLYLLLLKMTHNTTTATDLTVDTFSKAFCQLHRYAPTGTFGSWLFSIGVNTYIDHLRKRRPETLPLSALNVNPEGDYVEYQIPSGQPNPEEAMIRLQRDEALKQIIAQLKPAYRQIVELRYYEELSYEQIAQRLNLPMGTVKVRLARAKALLQSIIQKEGGLV